MALDLSMLDEPHTSAGAMLALPLDEIEEDPAQPRKQFSQASLDAMAKRIREKGQVEIPVTVRPKRNGKYRLVDGARRFRSSRIAGMTTIRAIVEADHTIDPYTQVVVNLQREELQPMELAKFIEQRRAAGDSLGRVAEALGISARDVTTYLSFLSAPASVLDAFHAERLRSVYGVYDLCRLHAHDAGAVEAFMARHVEQEITRSMILQLQEAIRRDANSEVPADEPTERVASPDVSAGNGVPPPDSPHEDVVATDGGADVSSASVHELPFHNPDIERQTKPPRLDDPTRIRKPLLLADYEGCAVMVRLDRTPTAPGLAFIKYEDGRGELEVELGVLRNWTLTESKVSQ
ncbi:ParB/RepB/Spo0J family partition protein [Burkholderia cenocepacia]|nr:ParB/RepB/Spo0J family partition protein [Burkholderia cenocepacia]